MSQPLERVCHRCQTAWSAAKVMSIKTLTLSRCIKYFQYAYKSEATQRQTTETRVGKLPRPGAKVAAQLSYGRATCRQLEVVFRSGHKACVGASRPAATTQGRTERRASDRHALRLAKPFDSSDTHAHEVVTSSSYFSKRSRMMSSDS